jgi:hypothetical protein
MSITSANIFGNIQLPSARPVAGVTRQASDFLALLLDRLGETGEKSPAGGAPVGQNLHGAAVPSLKPMSWGLPIDLQLPIPEAPKPQSLGAPTTIEGDAIRPEKGPAPTTFGAPEPETVSPKATSYGAPEVLEQSDAIGEDPSSNADNFDVGAPGNELKQPTA